LRVSAVEANQAFYLLVLFERSHTKKSFGRFSGGNFKGKVWENGFLKSRKGNQAFNSPKFEINC
jgi:hypothetical protein